MSLTPQVSAEGNLQPPARTGSVILGRQDYLSVLLRLIGMELYKVRRRTMSKVLGMLAFAIVLIVFLLVSLGTFFVLNTPPETFSTSCQGQIQGSKPTNCSQLSAAQLAQNKQDLLQTVSEPLRLPDSLNIIVQVALPLGAILIVILVGSMAGGEFNLGTVRLMFTRGPTRTQFLLAKVGATLFCTVIGVLLMSITGILVGQLLNFASGIGQNFNFFSAGWSGHMVLYVLAAMLNWFIYATIAIFFGTLGRSTVAGMMGALMWFLVEAILGGLLNLAGIFSRGPFGDFLKAIPDYFIGNNIGALMQNQEQYIFGASSFSLFNIFGANSSTISNTHALIVLAVYLAAFIGLACWINERRDVTN
jgi:ABC-type transport system involved in multi-copper enzyme maturation permease subunit